VIALKSVDFPTLGLPTITTTGNPSSCGMFSTMIAAAQNGAP
jgi:hypothetical protein